MNAVVHRIRGAVLGAVPAVARLLAQEPAEVEVAVRTGAAARVVVADHQQRVGRDGAAARVPAGHLTVHFAADAAGKPRSLSAEVPPGAQVRAAASWAEPGAETPVAIAEAKAVGAGVALRAVPATEVAATRVRTVWRTLGAAASAGPAVRIAADGSHYRGVWNALSGEFQLVRRLGSDEFVIAAAKAIQRPEAGAELALQVDGFRLQLVCDEAIVLQTFDGALDRGWIGWWADGGAELGELARADATGDRASVLLVQQPGRATLVAATMAPPGGLAVLELCLDRPHAVVPPGLSLAVEAVLPSLGPIVPIDRNSLARCELQLPHGAPWGGLAYLARFLLIDADGAAIAGRTPAVAVTLPRFPH